MAETTLDELILKIARRLGRAVGGTATSGSTTTLIDTASLYQPDNTWVAHYLRVTKGDNANLERLITAHAQASKTVTLDPAFPYAVADGDDYQITPLEYAYYVDAISNAIASAGDAWVGMRDDTTTLTYTGAQEYSLPTDLLMVHQLWSGDGTYWAPVHTYEILGVPGAYKLMLRDWPGALSEVTGLTSSQMRILYSASPIEMTSPSQGIGMGGTSDRQAILYIQEMALHFIHQMLWSRNPVGEQARSHMSKSGQHYEHAMRLKADRKPFAPPPTNRNRRYAEQI